MLTQEISVGDSRLFDGMFGVARVDWLSQPGYVVCVTTDVVAKTWTRLTDAGILPAGAAAFHTLRIETGFPWFGVDVTDENLPQEVGRTENAVSFTKGCYLGQEPIARLDAMGHVNRELCVLRFESDVLPESGAAIHAVDDDREVGKITSAARLSKSNRAARTRLFANEPFANG